MSAKGTPLVSVGDVRVGDVLRRPNGSGYTVTHVEPSASCVLFVGNIPELNIFGWGLSYLCDARIEVVSRG